MMKKYLFFALLTAFLGVGVQAQTVFSAVSPSGHTLYYRVIDAGNHYVELVNPNNTDGIWGEAWENHPTPYGNVVVPQTVTNQGTEWTVKRIGRSAFASCPTVKRVTLPDGIDSIQAYAFFGTEIDSVNIPGSVVYIGSSNFHNSQLRYINLPASLEYIDPWENDGPGALACSVEEGNPYYRSINGCLVRHVNDLVTLITYPRGSIVDSLIVIPEGITRVDENTMEQIMWESRRIVFPSTVTYIHLPWFSHDTIEIHNPLPPAYGDWCNHDFQDDITLLVPCGSMQRYNATAWTIVGDIMATIDYPIQKDYAQTITYGESYTWDGLTLTERGVYEDTLQSVVEGCDSVHRVLTLNVVQTYKSDVLLTDGMSVDFHGLVVDRPGVYDIHVPGEGDFDSLFVLRASAAVNATLSTVEMGGVFAGETFDLPAAQSRQFVRGEDTVTVTNIHQLLYDTVDVTIAEGGSYRGYTLAGVYQDTILGADTDSIIRSRVSMTVNRPLDNCTVQLGGNMGGTYFQGNEFYAAGTSEVAVLPSESETYLFAPEVLGENLLALSDMENDDHGAIYRSLYAGDYPSAIGAGIEGFNDRGVDNSRCLWFRGTTEADKAFFRAGLSTKPGEKYILHFMVANGHPSYAVLALRVNGDIWYPADTLRNGIDSYRSLDYVIEANADTTTIELLNLQTELDPYWGSGMNEIEWYIDNISLTKVFSPNLDSITVTNTHGLIRNTMDVTIAEGGSYRGYTQAGVYQDTILGADTDSIIRSRVSMTVNRPLDNCMVQLGGKLGGTYFHGNEFYAANAEVPVPPASSKTILYSPETLGVNLLTFTDENYSNYNLYCGDYCTSPDCSAYGDWGDRGVDGSTAIYFRGSCDVGLAFFRTTLNTRAGEQYLLRYMATAGGNPERPILALKVNGVQTSQTDTLENCCMEPMWGTFEHLITATDDTTTIELVNLQGWDTQYWISGIYHNEWFMDNFRLIKVYSIPTDSITITNTHGLIYDTVDVTIAEDENYHNHTLAGVYQDTILGSETDSIVYARVSMDINYSYGNGSVSVATDQEGRMWMGLDDDVLTTEPVFSAARPNPTEERRYVLTSLADNSNMQPNGGFEQGWNYCSNDYAWGDIPFQGSHYFTVCDTCGRTGKGVAAKGSGLENRYVYTSEWVNLVEGRRYSFSYWAKSHSGNPAQLAVDLHDQQNTYRVADTADLGEAMDGWKRFEHVFTAYRTYASLLRITDLNTSSDGNEFFLDDVSIIDLTEATNAQRDTIRVLNIHQLVYTTVDTTLNEGENYNGHTTAGVYNDTVVLADYDSIVRSRISYVLNASGEGTALLGSNTEGQWIDLDDNTIYNIDSVNVAAMQTRRFARLVPAADTNLIVNGDFEQGNTGFTSHFLYRPEPYDLGDETYYIGGYRINQNNHNHYFYALNYWDARQGAPYEVTVNVVPDMWYALSFRGVSGHNSNSDGHAVVPRNVLVVNGQYLAADSLPYDANADINVARTFSHAFYNGSDSTITLSLASPSYAAWTHYGWGNYDGVYGFAYDDVSLVPLKFADTITITNRHQIVYATVDTTINEGESYNGYTLAGVYVDTLYFTDYDSITTSRISMVINSLDGEVSLSSNNLGWWKDINDNVLSQSPTVTTQVPPMQSSQFIFDGQVATGNILVNGDFEQGTVGFSSQYNYSDGCRGCGPNNYAVLSDLGVDGSSCLSFDGSETAGTVLYEQTVQAISGATYRLNYMATTNGLDNSNPAYFEVLVNGVAIGNWDYITSNYPVWNTFEHTFVANSGTLTLQIIDRNAEGSGNDCLIDEMELTAIGGTNLANDTITITNRHQLVYATVDTTINEGESYNGHTLAGVYVDTLYFTDYDSIVRSRISMVVNRPADDAIVSVASNTRGKWKYTWDNNTDTIGVTVMPMESVQKIRTGSYNLIANGDFENAEESFNTYYTNTSGENGSYTFGDNYGAGNTRGVYFDGSTTNTVPFYYVTLNLIPGHLYSFNYSIKAVNGNPPIITTSVNGIPLHYLETEDEVWMMTSQAITATTENTTIALTSMSLEYWGNDFYFDNVGLEDVTPGLPADTITITNRHQLVYDTTRVDICQGSVVTMDSVDYGNAGTYNLNTRFYEDSTVHPTLVLGVHNNYYPQLMQAICEGESYAFGGNTLTATGIYTDSLTTVWGCDSTITLDLTVHSHTASLQTEDVCDSYSWHGSVYTASAIVADTIANVHGCDSVCTLNLTVRHSTAGDTLATACDNFQWYGQTYTASGMPTHMLTNSVGCDSTLTLTLTVNYSTSGNETFTVCDSMTWHDNLYTASGTYQDVLTNGVGCDSTVSLHLTVNSTYHHTDAVFACDNHMPYTYQGTDLTEAGEHQVVLQSAEGCDSTVTVTLTVGTTYRHDDQLTLCQSGMPYTYGVQTFEADDESGIYEIPFSSVEGCDSLIDLNLTIHESEATEIYVVTVNSIYNMVVWEHQANIEHYNIYRESSTAGNYTLMAEVPFDNVNMWIDSSSDNRSRSYRYRISSTDSCGVESEMSDIHKTMHLTISQGINNSWNLVWTEYEGTMYTTYRIYRGDSYNNLTMIDEIPAANTTYTDYNAPSGDVYYQITILLNSTGSKEALPNTINSNIATNASEVGIEDVQDYGSLVYVKDGAVVVESMVGEHIRLYDVSGRKLHHVTSSGKEVLDVPVSGTYLVKVGNKPAHRVVVLK